MPRPNSPRLFASVPSNSMNSTEKCQATIWKTGCKRKPKSGHASRPKRFQPLTTRRATPGIRHLRIKIDGVTYTGEYDPATSGDYTPTEFNAGAPVEVFFEGDNMILKRRNGEQLRTRIVRREREETHGT